MPNVTIPNSIPTATNDTWSSIWKLTRGLKKAGWRYKASSDASAKDTTGNPANDKWGAGVQVGSQTATASFTIGTRTTSAKAGRVTISGLTGFTTSSPGNFLTIAGATNSANNGTWLITKYNSATSVDIENPAAVAETTPGTATWTEITALTDTMPAAITSTSGVGAWWCGEGPSTMKIPIGNAVTTGTFIRGENVTQATTGATGELLGVMMDTSSGGQGHLVIAPRASGTGASVRGWNNSSTITGSISGATVTPTGTPIEFIREIVFWKASISTGHLYYQVIDSVNENTPSSTNGRFSEQSTLAGCTATICPGGEFGNGTVAALPSANGFPVTGTRIIWGTGGPITAGTVTTNAGTNFLTSGAGTPWGVFQVMVANNIEDTNISQDGSYILAFGSPTTSPTSFFGTAFQRCDDTEEGDLDPYVHWNVSSSGAAYNSSRTTNTSNVSGTDTFNSAYFCAGSTTSYYRGFRRRGFPTEDQYQDYQGGMLGSFGTTQIIVSNSSTVERVATAPVTTTVREPVWVISTQLGQKQRKGTLRWFYFVPNGAGCDTYDNKKWVQLSSATVPVIAGPWDGTTTPSNS